MSKEYTQLQLERMVLGEEVDPNIQFFEQAVLNIPESKRLKKRVYDRRVMFKRTVPGLPDWTAAMASKEMIAEYPNEYQYFLVNTQGVRKPGIEIIPNLDIIHMQELKDYGLATVEALAAADVPPHLQYAKDTALVLQSVLQESRDGQENTIEEESRSEESIAPHVSASDRRDDPTGVCQRPVPARTRSEEREVAQGIQASGQVNGSGHQLIPDAFNPNWDLAIE